MPNVFITPQLVARDAAITLSNRLIVGNSVGREQEGLFTASKIGDSVTVTVPPVVSDADEFSGTTQSKDVTELSHPLKLEKHFYKRVDLTSKQKSLELSDFTRLITVPVVQGIQESIDKYFLRKMQVFRANLTGAVGNRPSTMAHLASATQKLNDNKMRKDGRVALIDSTVENVFSQLIQFQNSQYAADGQQNLREGVLGRRYGFDFLPDVNLGAFDRGDIAGTVTVATTTAAGLTNLPLTAFTAATGTVRAGTVFTIAGDATRYVVRSDAAIVGNAAAVEIYPALQADAVSTSVCTIEAAGYSNLVYHPYAVAGAIVAPTPLAIGSHVESFNGVSIRVSMDSSIVSLSDSIVFDVFAGCDVINPLGGALFCG